MNARKTGAPTVTPWITPDAHLGGTEGVRFTGLSGVMSAVVTATIEMYQHCFSRAFGEGRQHREVSPDWVSVKPTLTTNARLNG